MKQRLTWVFLGLIGACYLLAVLPGLGSQPLRIDEAVQVGLVELSLPNLLRELPRNDPHPPAYHLFLKAWTGVFGQSPFAVRLPSVFFGLLALWAMFGLGRRLGGTVTGLFSAGFLGGSLFFLHYSQTARMYTLLLALTTFSLSSLLAYVKHQRRKDLLWWWLNASLLVWVHYLGLLEIAVEWFLLMVVAFRTPHLPVRRAWLRITGATVAAVTPLVALWWHQLLLAPDRRFPFLVPTGDVVGHMWRTLLLLHTGPEMAGYGGPAQQGYALTCLGLAGLGVVLLFGWRREKKDQGTLLLGYLLLVLYGVLMVLVRVNSFYQIRYFVSALSAYLALAGLAAATVGLRLYKNATLPPPVRWLALGAWGVVCLSVVFPPALFEGLRLWASREEVPYRRAAATLRRYGIKRVVYTGLERTPMAWAAPALPTLWANTREQLTLALQGDDRRAVVVYPHIADRVTEDQKGFTPWLRPWLRSLGGKEIMLKGSQSPLALYLFNQPIAWHGVRLKPQRTLLPLPGDYECRSRDYLLLRQSKGAVAIHPKKPCFLRQNRRPVAAQPNTEPNFFNPYFNHYLHWTGFLMGPSLKKQRLHHLRFWPVDRIYLQNSGSTDLSEVTVLPPRGPGEWPAITVGNKTRVAYSFYAWRRGRLNLFWRLNFPGHALLSVQVNGQRKDVRLSPNLRESVFFIARPGPAMLEVENRTAAPVELQGVEFSWLP